MLISLASCSSRRYAIEDKYFPVRTHTERKSSLGFSITPPPGSGWYEKLSENSLYYLKKLHTKSHTIYTKASEIEIQQSYLEESKLVDFVKKQKEKNIDTRYVKNLSTSYAIDPGLAKSCVRYKQAYEDHGIKHLAGNQFVQVSRAGIVCLHPLTPNVGVDMFYVESYVQPTTVADASFSHEGEYFLSSLKFSAPTDG